MSTLIQQTALFRMARSRVAKTRTIDLLSVKGTMQRSDDDAADGSVSRDFVSGLLSEKEIMQFVLSRMMTGSFWALLNIDTTIPNAIFGTIVAHGHCAMKKTQ
jgi:hypothetical protein